MIKIDKEDLLDLYARKKLSTIKIARIYNCADVTIWRKLKKYNIPITRSEFLVGRKFSDGHKRKLSIAHKGKRLSKEHRQKISEHLIGNSYAKGVTRTYSKERNKKISLAKLGKPHPGAGWNKNKTFKDDSRILHGKAHPMWKGGVTKTNVPTFNEYAKEISYAEETRRSLHDQNVLEVKCIYCDKWFIPSYFYVIRRIAYLKGTTKSENRFYCSVGCAKSCPIYKQQKYPRGYKKATSREVQAELRKMVFERDGWRCQKCWSSESLHCHHITGIVLNPIESADVDNCITLCAVCHKWVHSKEGCRYFEMKCGRKAA